MLAMFTSKTPQLLVLVGLIFGLVGCQPSLPPEQAALKSAVEAALQLHLAPEYVIIVEPVGIDQVAVTVQWLAERGPGNSGLELMVPEEADRALWNFLLQHLSAEEVGRVTRVFFERVE